MSLLAPLYFFGAAAIGLPILFHLIRRQPKGQVEFSSLMFLQPTPPRLTRRSRLDNWLLLMLRALALLLMAAAFTRPFLRSASVLDFDPPARRIVLLVDKSASMQRSGLWAQVIKRSGEVIDDLQKSDQLAVVAFDGEPTTLLGFEQSSELSIEQTKSTAKRLLSEIGPTWRSTELGRAIQYAGDLAVTYESDEAVELDDDGNKKTENASKVPANLVLVSDMQQGSEIESLQTYAWPDELRLDIRTVVPKKRTNVSATILADTPETVEENRVRVRVSNVEDSSSSSFRIAWQGADGEGVENANVELPVQVPPGESRVVRMSKPAPGVTSLAVRGDDHSFDNTRFVVTPTAKAFSLLHIGPKASDSRESLLYYLKRVPLSNTYRQVSVESVDPGDLPNKIDAKKTPLVVINSPVATDAAVALQAYVKSGGRLLVVFSTDQQADAIATSLNTIASCELQVSEAKVRDYAMLSKIDFTSTVFQPMADPKFNDFTKVRFWSHRSLSGFPDDESWKVIARFDDGDPAIAQASIELGQVVVMTAGWQPDASQLALSTKFIPLVFSLFESGRELRKSDGYIVGESIDFAASETATIMNPSGSKFEYRTKADAGAIDEPGVYRFEDGDEIHSFAVNLDPAESQTQSMDEETLERFSIALGKTVTTAEATVAQRQLRDRELEACQKIWQWLLIAALALLGLETVLGALRSRRSPTPAMEG